jgi:beta-glucosidase
LDKGNYIIRVGNSSRNTQVYGYVRLTQNIVTEQLKNIVKTNPGFDDYVPDIKKYPKDIFNDVRKLSLTKEDFELKIPSENYVYKIYDSISKLKNKELAYLCVGGFVENREENNEKERGLNGLTTRKVKTIKNIYVWLMEPQVLE